MPFRFGFSSVFSSLFLHQHSGFQQLLLVMVAAAIISLIDTFVGDKHAA